MYLIVIIITKPSISHMCFPISQTNKFYYVYYLHALMYMCKFSCSPEMMLFYAIWMWALPHKTKRGCSKFLGGPPLSKSKRQAGYPATDLEELAGSHFSWRAIFNCQGPFLSICTQRKPRAVSHVWKGLGWWGLPSVWFEQGFWCPQEALWCLRQCCGCYLPD